MDDKMTGMRRAFAALALLLATAGAVSADAVTDRVVRQLQDQGYRTITISRTFLGRVRVKAASREFEREIVINPSSGEILRDYWEAAKGRGSDGDRVIDTDDDDRDAKDADDRDDRGDRDRDDRDDRDSDDRDDRDSDDRDSDNSGKGGGDRDSDSDSDNSGKDGGDRDSDSDSDSSGKGGGDDD